MDKEKRARIDVAKRELDDILQSLIGNADGNAAAPPIAIFTGTVHIAKWVMCPLVAENDREELLPCE